MKTGIMGGTFNPIHIAHLRVAEEARESCNLDRVIFVPASVPPHKPVKEELSFALRCEMVRAAIEGNPFFQISTAEGERPGKSYSIDTISRFSIDYPDDELFFITGSDSFLEISLWRSYASLFALCDMIVVERPGKLINDIMDAVPNEIRGRFSLESGISLIHESGHKVCFVSGALLDVSSSRIRELAAAGRSIKYLVPPGTEKYIKEKRIYKQCS